MLPLLTLVASLMLALGAAESSDASRIVGALRTLNTAETTYRGQHLKEGFACRLAQLGPAKSGVAAGAGLINAELASGSYAGYAIKLQCVPDDYQAIAIPKSGTGDVFCIDKSALVRTSAAAATCIREGVAPRTGAATPAAKPGS